MPAGDLIDRIASGEESIWTNLLAVQAVCNLHLVRPQMSDPKAKAAVLGRLGFVNDQWWSCPAQETIAELVGLSKRSVQRGEQIAEHCGVLKRVDDRNWRGLGRGLAGRFGCVAFVIDHELLVAALVAEKKRRQERKESNRASHSRTVPPCATQSSPCATQSSTVRQGVTLTPPIVTPPIVTQPISGCSPTESQPLLKLQIADDTKKRPSVRRTSHGRTVTPRVTQSHGPRAPDPTELAAYAMLGAAYAIVLEHTDVPLSSREWKVRNKRGAMAMLEAGKSTDDVVAMLKKAYTDPQLSKFYGGITRLDKLAEAWPRLAGKNRSGRVYEDFTPLPEYRREIFTERGLEPIVRKQ